MWREICIFRLNASQKQVSMLPNPKDIAQHDLNLTEVI